MKRNKKKVRSHQKRRYWVSWSDGSNRGERRRKAHGSGRKNGIEAALGGQYSSKTSKKPPYSKKKSQNPKHK